MDTKEFLIFAREAFDAIEERLDTFAVNNVDLSTDGPSMLLLVSDTDEIRLTTDLKNLRIVATAKGHTQSFRYHDIEEQWLEEAAELEFFAWLGSHIPSILGEAIHLRGGGS